MTETSVAGLGASRWMGRVLTVADQTFPQFFGTHRRAARVVALMLNDPSAAANLAFRAPGARISEDGQHICQIADACMESARTQRRVDIS